MHLPAAGHNQLNLELCTPEGFVILGEQIDTIIVYIISRYDCLTFTKATSSVYLCVTASFAVIISVFLSVFSFYLIFSLVCVCLPDCVALHGCLLCICIIVYLSAFDIICLLVDLFFLFSLSLSVYFSCPSFRFPFTIFCGNMSWKDVYRIHYEFRKFKCKTLSSSA